MNKVKKVLALAMALVLCVSSPAGALVPLLHNSVFKVGSVDYTVDGVGYTMEAAPYIKDGRTLVPLRYIGYALGIAEKDIAWDEGTKTATITNGTRTVQVKLGSSSILINNDAREMGVTPEVSGGRIMLPLRSVAEAFSAVITWDSATQEINVHY